MLATVSAVAIWFKAKRKNKGRKNIMAQKNADLIENYLFGAKVGIGSNLIIIENDLVHYSTVICRRDADPKKENVYYLNEKKISQNTSTHQNRIRAFAKKNPWMKLLPMPTK
jgi:hypothetical protein